MADQTKVTGGCLCGAVRYEADAPPVETGYCHCRMCQKNVGNVFALYSSFPTAGFRFVQGAPKIYRSSSFAERGFCADCGTPLTFQYLARRGRISATAGSLDRPDLAPPNHHVGVQDWVPWLKIDDGLPRGRTEDNPDFAGLSAYSQD